MSRSTPNYVNDHWYTADQWNAMARFSARELMDSLLRMLFGDVDPSTDAAGVIGGFASSAVPATMDTSVAAGIGLLFNATVYTSTLDGDETASDLGSIWTRAATVLTHAAADAVNDRIDLIVASSTLGTDTPKTVGVKGGAPVAQDLRWGAETVIEIVAGTPAGAPVVPSTPVGKMALYEVTVHALDAAATLFDYQDARVYVPGPLNRQEQPIRFKTHDITGDQVQVHLEDGAASPRNQLQGISLTELWPYFFRDAAGAAGEAAGAAQPMLMWNGDRTHKETRLWADATLHATEDNVDYDDVQIWRGTDGATDYGLSLDKTNAALAITIAHLNFKAEHRAMKLTEIEVQYNVVEAHAAATWEFKVFKWDASASAYIPLHAAALTATNVIGPYTQTITLIGTHADLCMAEGDAFEVQFYGSWDGANFGHIKLWRATAKWEEGQVP